MKVNVRYSVSYCVEIDCNPSDLTDAISNIQIPETAVGGEYVKKSFHVLSVEKDTGEPILI